MAVATNEFSEVVMGVAFAIEDPCGLEAIELARALVELGRAVPEQHRKTIVGMCNRLVRQFGPRKGEDQCHH